MPMVWLHYLFFVFIRKFYGIKRNSCYNTKITCSNYKKKIFFNRKYPLIYAFWGKNKLLNTKVTVEDRMF